ncbi:hypothetical protein ZYGR_0N04130 [Zygosaccharomyces rouxii]|uniref:WW domain-containing protein n=1 Tax=Zygosaccharomyces rouxii TaxID=4956 RepID=A0A1Q2ZZZ2_ZYGRO|nr:hypothetical protein ZYGR_0N04130 [Zygosaccharomyces rouxii]
MARIWREYVAPDGRKYYYNAVTKQSTWHKPESLDEMDENRGVKRFKKIESKPHVALELYHGWHLVICDTGKKFYYNVETNESVWNLPDEGSRNLIDALDKNKLVALIGLVRGYSPGGLHIYEELVTDLVKLRQEREAKRAEGDQEKDEATGEEVKDEDEEKDKANGEEVKEEDRDQNDGEDNDAQNGLVAGYSSSSESEDEDEGEGEGEEPLNIPITESVEEPVDISGDKKALWDLFTRYDLNPYSAWPFEMKKIRDDPDFLRVLDDSVREDVFEEWCAHAISGDQVEPVDEIKSEDFDEEEDHEPTKYHYLAHIVSKSNITPTTIFMDIKNDNKSLFKKYNIKDFLTSKKDQESFVSKLLFYYKRMKLEERKEVFIQLLKQNGKTIEENLSNDMDKVRHCLAQEIDSNDPYAVETKLFKMEKFMGLWGNLSDLVEEPKYYILGIRDKMLELNDYLKIYV